jgi:predicted nucleotidyltransferase
MQVSPAASALAPEIQEILEDFVRAARAAFGDVLRSIVLYGSAAEGRMRATSDLNLLVILRTFEKSQVDTFREPLRLARVAASATVMFVMESELAAAAENFAVKFDDITRRHRVLCGEDLVAGLSPSRQAKKARLVQVLLNLSMRLRGRYASVSLREEQLAAAIADSAGPMRSAAATLLELEGTPAASPKAALATVAAQLDPKWAELLEKVSEARETGSLPAGQAPGMMFELIGLAMAMRHRAEEVG